MLCTFGIHHIRYFIFDLERIFEGHKRGLAVIFLLVLFCKMGTYNVVVKSEKYFQRGKMPNLTVGRRVVLKRFSRHNELKRYVDCPKINCNIIFCYLKFEFDQIDRGVLINIVFYNYCHYCLVH